MTRRRARVAPPPANELHEQAHGAPPAAASNHPAARAPPAHTVRPTSHTSGTDLLACDGRSTRHTSTTGWRWKLSTTPSTSRRARSARRSWRLFSRPSSSSTASWLLAECSCQREQHLFHESTWRCEEPRTSEVPAGRGQALRVRAERLQARRERGWLPAADSDWFRGPPPRPRRLVLG